MNPKINQAIDAFIINEFKLNTKSLDEDLDFFIDLGLDANQMSDFLSRLQEALSLIINEDRASQIKTLSDLHAALDPESDDSSI